MINYSYLASGVDIEGADNLAKYIKNIVKNNSIGEFAGIFEHPVFEDYYLCACTDGVGTKIKPLIERCDTKTLAVDLVAMNLNDLICTGAKPLFFLDYIAINKLDNDLVSKFLYDLNETLKSFNCALLGGETSELGDLILNDYFDAAGFMVGAVKKENFINKNNVSRGDIIVALKSSGAHSNGFTLLRKLYSDKLLDEKIFNEALNPTKIYFEIVMKLNEKKLLKSCANITGGGILSNLKRALPRDLRLELDYNLIPKSALFERLKELLREDEAYKTFNMGVGFCLIVSPDNLAEVLTMTKDWESFVLGKVV